MLFYKGKNFKVRLKQGFTVLEFLIAIGIIAILISLVLVGLNRVRSHSRDQELISKLQTVTLGLYQFYDICGFYPATLSGSEVCPALDNQSKTIVDLLPELVSLKFNEPESRFLYTGIGGSSIGASCPEFHIGVRLNEPTEVLGLKKSGVNSSNTLDVCGDGTPFDGTQDTVFDIKK